MLDAKIRMTDEARELRQIHTFLSHLNGKQPSRENVHYVRYSHHPEAGDVSDEELMMDILLELPEQHAEYCRMKGFKAAGIEEEEAADVLTDLA